MDTSTKDSNGTILVEPFEHYHCGSSHVSNDLLSTEDSNGSGVVKLLQNHHLKTSDVSYNKDSSSPEDSSTSQTKKFVNGPNQNIFHDLEVPNVCECKRLSCTDDSKNIPSLTSHFGRPNRVTLKDLAHFLDGPNPVTLHDLVCFLYRQSPKTQASTFKPNVTVGKFLLCYIWPNMSKWGFLREL